MENDLHVFCVPRPALNVTLILASCYAFSERYTAIITDRAICLNFGWRKIGLENVMELLERDDRGKLRLKSLPARVA